MEVHMKRRIISNFLCALLIMINVLNQPFGIVHAEEIEKIYDYTVLALSSDGDSFVMDVAGGNINGNVASISSFELPNVNINGRNDEKVEVDFSNLLSAIDERYFTNAVIYESSEDCLYNVNESIVFSGNAEFCDGINLNGSIKAFGDIIMSGTVNINNGCIVSETGNVTIETDNISLMGLVYAPNGTLTLKGNNVNLNNVCIIANKVNIVSPNYINISSNTELMNFVNETVTYGINDDHGEGGEEIIDPIDPYSLFDFGNFSQFVYASAKIVDNSIEIYWYTNVDSDTSKIYEIKNGVQNLIAEVAADSKYNYQCPSDLSEISFVVERAGIYSYPFRVCKVNGSIQVIIDDSDGDGLDDALETIITSDAYDVDTDDDGLSDYYELIELGTSPLNKDTDGDGIDDNSDDMDGDGISNQDEFAFNTNPFSSDSDDDKLSDWDEIYTYHTNPRLNDTDSDGADDKYEIDNGYDPLVPNASFVVEKSYGEVSEANPVSASVRVELSNGPIDSLTIEKVNPHDNPFITPSVAGIMGTGYSFEVDADFQTAELIFEYNTEIYGELSDEFQPRIYYFNEDTKMFEELENQIVENGTVRATTTHFSIYSLINKPKYESVWKILISSSLPPESDQTLPVIVPSFPIDSSIETPTTTPPTPPYMNPDNGNYLYIERIIDAYGPIDNYSFNRILGFDEDVAKRVEEVVDMAHWDNYFYCYNSAGNGVYSYQTHDFDLTRIDKNFDYMCMCNYRYAIVLVTFYGSHINESGYDEYYDHLLEYAKNNHIVLNIVSLSNSDRDYLKNIANQTGGDFYLYTPQDVERLLDTIPFELVGSRTTSNSDEDMVTDSNNDGISDYYTRLIKEGKLLLSNSSNEFMGVDFNYDCNGNFSDDWDGDGIKNGDEIEVVTQFGKTYLKMASHPMRAYSDGDMYSDLEEIQNGTEPFVYNINKNDKDWLTNDWIYSYENIADMIMNDTAVSALLNYSAIINGIFNKTELYRDLLIDYFSTYTSLNMVNESILYEEKNSWIDYLTFLQSNVTKYLTQPYDFTKNINVLINYLNGNIYVDFNADFVNQVTLLIQELNRVSEDATEFRASVYGNTYIKNYIDTGKLLDKLGPSVKILNNISLGVTVLSYGVDVFDTISNISIVNSNNKMFEYNMDILDNIFVFSENDTIRAATLDIKQLLTEKYTETLLSAIGDDIKESAIDLAIIRIAVKNNYVAIVVAVRDVMNLLADSKTDVQQAYRIICYSELCKAYERVFQYILKQSNASAFYTTFDTTVFKVNNSLVNIAQIRVLGEQEYYEYVKNEGLLANLINYVNGLSEVRDIINHSITKVSEKMDLLGLKAYMSEKIIYSVN